MWVLPTLVAAVLFEALIRPCVSQICCDIMVVVSHYFVPFIKLFIFSLFPFLLVSHCYHGIKEESKNGKVAVFTDRQAIMVVTFFHTDEPY